MPYKCHINDSTKSRYNIIPVIYLLTYFGIYIKLFKHTILGDAGPYKMITVYMVNLNSKNFKSLIKNDRIKPKEYL